MDRRERFLSYFEGGIPDVTPLFLRDFTLGLDVLKCMSTDLFGERYDPELASRSVLSFAEFTGQDAVIGCVHSPAFIVEQFGGRMRYTDWGVPTPLEHPFTSPSKLDSADTVLKGKALDAVEAYHITAKAGKDLAILGNITGPLTKASVLMDMDILSLALHDDIGFVNDVIRIGMESTKSYLEMIRDDIDAVFIASATDNPSLFGNEMVNSVTVPFLRDMVDLIHSMGKYAIYHPHGDYTDRSVMDPAVSTGIDCFHFAEDNDPTIIRELIDDRCIVMGGTDIIPTLYSGTVEEVRSETRRYLDAFMGARYIFTCSCALQRNIPLPSIKEMCGLVRSPLQSA